MLMIFGIFFIIPWLIVWYYICKAMSMIFCKAVGISNPNFTADISDYEFKISWFVLSSVSSGIGFWVMFILSMT